MSAGHTTRAHGHSDAPILIALILAVFLILALAYFGLAHLCNHQQKEITT